MDASFVTTQGTTVHYDCVVKLHRLEETTEYERPSVTRQVRRSQRVKLKREREPKSSEEREPTNKTVKGERTRKDVERIQVAAKGADSNRRSKEACSSGHQHLSEYELKRLENIKQNKSFLCFLELPQVLEALRTKPKSSQRIIKKVKAVEVLPHRKSLRLQSKGLSETSAAGPVRKIRACKPAEHVQVNPINMDENSRLPEGLLKLWTEDYIKEDQHLPDLNRYLAHLKMMSIDANAVAKVVTRGINSAAFHPCSTSLLVAAGDSMGHLGLWTLVQVTDYQSHTHWREADLYPDPQPPGGLNGVQEGERGQTLVAEHHPPLGIQAHTLRQQQQQSSGLQTCLPCKP